MTGINETADMLFETSSFYSFESPIYLLALPFLTSLMAFYVLRKGLTKKRIVYAGVRAIILSLLVIAMASPVHVTTLIESGDHMPLTVLVDGSSSMSLYEDPQSLGQTILGLVGARLSNSTSDNSRIKLEVFSAGNRTAIGDALYASFVSQESEPQNIVLITDGANNHGRDPLDMARVMGRANTTIYTVRPVPKAGDIYIENVFGDKKIPANIDYEVNIRVANTLSEPVTYQLSVHVNDRQRYSRRITQNHMVEDITLSIYLGDIGTHMIRIEIDAEDDLFEANNVYYKAVKVVEKPRILLVCSECDSPLSRILSKLYDVRATSTVDADYSRYAAVLFDDVGAEKLSRHQVNKIKGYVLEGNGVAFIGGKNSFEFGGYNNSFIEAILPVQSTEKPVDRRKNFAIVFMIDISGSTEESMDMQKALALRMLRALDDDDNVGVLAFNWQPHTVSPLSPLGPKFGQVEDSIMRLKFGGGTDMVESVDAGRRMLDGTHLKKYLIVISDGVVRRSRWQLTYNLAQDMRQDGVSVYTVGVGFETDEAYMRELARHGGGQYFSLRSDPDARLKLLFGDQDDEKDGDMTPVVIADEYHYITRRLHELETSGSSVSGFNRVSEKEVAQKLISTKGGNPILTVWQFGLGRVAALSTDNGLYWSPKLMQVDSSRAVTGMTNWLIGDLEKTKEVRVSTQDAHLGQNVEYVVRSPEQPKVEIKHFDTLSQVPSIATKSSIYAYSGSFEPSMAGFWFMGAHANGHTDEEAFAVNYPIEYLDLSLNENLLRSISEHTGERLYDAFESHLIAERIISKSLEHSRTKVQKESGIWHYFCALALALYFLDALIRRILVFFKKTRDSGN